MSAIPPLALLGADLPLIGSVFGPPQWGIFDQGGNPIIAVGDASMVAVDAVGGVDYSRDYRISTYPQEQGAFASYNKVQVPFRAVLTFFISTTRFEFLSSVEQAVATLDLYVVATPEWSYPNANLTHYSYRRDSRNGVTLIRVDVWAEEVRVVSVSPGAQGQINQGNTQSTNAASPFSSGIVQAAPATSLP